MYEPPTGIVPKGREFATWLLDELDKIARDLNAPDVPGIILQELHAAPTKLYDGLTVLADGTDWDPGSGQGVYTYYGSAWNKLG